jgi:hypothetical protein
LLRASQTGMLYGDEIDYNAEQNPGGVASSALTHFGGAIFFAALAAGYTAEEVWQFAVATLRPL